MNSNLTPEQQKLAELERFKFEVIKPFYDQYEAALKAAAEKHGVDSYFQDATGIVHKIVEPKGTFVSYQKFGVLRTRYAEEIEAKAKGSLSMTEAREAGFVVEGK